MSFARSIRAALVATLLFAAPALAQESGNFVVRLGQDTTGAEHYTRSAKQLVIDQVGRAPRVLNRHYVFDYAPTGAVTAVNARITLPGAAADAPAFQTISSTFTADSVFFEARRDTAVLQRLRVAVPAGAVVVSTGSPWPEYEAQFMKLMGQKSDSLRKALYLFGNSRTGWVTFRKLGKDSAIVQTETDLFHVHVDKQGRVLNVVPLRGTQKFSVDRVASLDLAAVTAGYQAHEKQAGVLGALSPRDTLRGTAGGATLWVDYGRPSKRGRVVFGGIVPWGEVWRTGANAATQFKTDKTLVFGAVEVPAGFYTLWTIPSPTGWKLVVNSETGQWGTEHKADKDLYTIDMKLEALHDPVERFTIGLQPGDTGGAFTFDWDATRATAPFTVKP